MLDIQSLAVAYGDNPVLEDVSLNIQAGEITAVIGPNGAGKSTLIRAVSGVIPKLRGRIIIAGQSLTSLSATQRARYLAVVPQARQLPAAFSVRQIVLLGRTPYLGWLGKSGTSDYELVEWALAKTQIQKLADRQVGELSGGEQQRVLLARALVQNAPVMLLDEPTTYLDLQHQSGLLNLVRQLAEEQKLAVLMVLHDLNLAGLYADKIALLTAGKIHTIGTPFEVLTSQNLSSVYNVPVQVTAHPAYGTPLILPDGVVTPKSKQKKEPFHVVRNTHFPHQTP